MKLSTINTKRRKLLAFTALVSGVTLAAPGAWSQSKAPLRFGVALPMSGSQAAWGRDEITVIEWAVADINAKGGVDGHPLEMVLVDNQAEAQRTISMANRLIHVDKVPVFLTSPSGAVKAVAPIANREKVLLISPASSASDIAKSGDYIYTTIPLADVDVAALAGYTYGTLGLKRVAVLYINNETGVEGARVYRDVFEKAGGQIVAYEAYDPKTSDFSGIVLKARAAKPDIIYIHGLIAEVPVLIGQIRQLGMTQRVSSYGAAYNPKIIEQLGASAEGLLVTSLAPGVADNPNVAGFVERWQKTEGRVSNLLPFTQYVYDSVFVIAELHKWVFANGLPVTGENLRKAMVAIKKFDLPMTGPLEIGDDHRARKPVYLLTVDKGKFVPVATIK